MLWIQKTIFATFGTMHHSIYFSFDVEKLLFKDIRPNIIIWQI